MLDFLGEYWNDLLTVITAVATTALIAYRFSVKRRTNLRRGIYSEMDELADIEDSFSQTHHDLSNTLDEIESTFENDSVVFTPSMKDEAIDIVKYIKESEQSLNNLWKRFENHRKRIKSVDDVSDELLHVYQELRTTGRRLLKRRRDNLREVKRLKRVVEDAVDEHQNEENRLR